MLYLGREETIRKGALQDVLCNLTDWIHLLVVVPGAHPIKSMETCGNPSAPLTCEPGGSACNGMCARC
jgi:hypothetical protein